MNVTINGTNYDYEPNFEPSEWKMQAGAYFKFPVTIGRSVCFVKRFQHKPCGWGLVQKLIGEIYEYLPKVYSAQEVIENNKVVYYFITEFLEGSILSDMLSKRNVVDIKNLPNQILKSLQVIHNKGYWFADFCEKNIYWASKSNRYVLIDLDSCEPLNVKPSHRPNTAGYIPGQEFANWTISFFRDILDYDDIEFSTINGRLLNFCQLVFLASKIGLFRLKLSENPMYAYPHITSSREQIHYFLYNKDEEKQSYIENIFKHIYEGNVNIELIETLCKSILQTEQEQLIEQYESELKVLKSKNQELEARLAKSILVFREMKALEVSLKNEIAIQKTLVEEKDNNIEKLKNAVKLSQTHNDRLIKQIKDLEKRLLLANQDKEESLEINKRLQTEKARLDKKFLNSQEYISKLKTSLQELETEKIVLTNEISTLIYEVSHLQEIVAYEDDNEQQNTSLKKTQSKLKREISRLRKENAKLRNETKKN
jgi:serine/threonine protein kinase